MYIMATAALGAVASNPLVQQAGKQVLGKASDAVLGGALGGVGKLIGGKKGQKVGKSIAKGMGKIRKGLFGFESGGKVRKVPMVVAGYSAGGVIAKPMVRPLPAPRRRPRK